jgi:hypothetical protein
MIAFVGSDDVPSCNPRSADPFAIADFFTVRMPVDTDTGPSSDTEHTLGKVNS